MLFSKERALSRNQGRLIEKRSGFNSRKRLSDAQSKQAFKEQENLHALRNQKKTDKFLQKHSQLTVKKARQTLDFTARKAPIAYEIISFGDPKIDRFISALEHLYTSQRKEPLRFELITNRKSRYFAANIGPNNTVYFSFEAIRRMHKKGFREFIHELRHAGNQNLIYKAEFIVSPAKQYRFKLGDSQLSEDYGGHFFAEEINNYMRWHEADQMWAMRFQDVVQNIFNETKRRLNQLDRVEKFLDKPNVFYAQEKAIFKMSHVYMIEGLNTHMPNHYETTLTLPDIDLGGNILTERRRAPLYKTPNQDAPALTLKLFSLNEPNKDTLTHLVDSVDNIDELLKTSHELAMKRAPRVKP